MDIDYNMSVTICKCLRGKCMLMNIRAFVGIWKYKYIYLFFGMFVLLFESRLIMSLFLRC